MKRTIGLLCAIALIGASLVPGTGMARGAVVLTEVDMIGVMPSDYVGTLTIESVNTVEKDYPSARAFPSQGVAVLPNGDVVVCDTGYGRIHILSVDLVHKRVIGSLGSGRGQLQYPADVAVDSAGNIYVADFFGNKVVKYRNDGLVLMEFGKEGKGAGQFEGPAGIAVTPDGSIWVADQLNDRLEQFTATGAYVTTVTGISRPAGMTLAGLVPYVVSSGDSAVYRLSGTKAVRIFAAPGEGENLIASAADLAVDAAGNIYVADRGTGPLPVPAVKVFSSSGQYLRSFGEYPADMTDIQDGEVLSPGGVAVTPDGIVYVMNSGFFRDATNPFGSGFHAKLIEYAPGGGLVAVQDYAIDVPGRLNNPQDVAMDGKGQLWVVCSSPVISTDGQTIGWNRGYVDVLDHSGNELFTVMQAGSRSMQLVESVAAGGTGLVYVAAQDVNGGFIAVYDEAGNYVRTIAAGKVDGPGDLEVASDGTLWACNQGDGSVVHLAADGTELGRFKTAGMPGGLTVLPNGDLLVCLWGESSEIQQVVRYSSKGAVIRVFGVKGGGRGTGQMYYPHDAMLLPDGLILVSDAENGRFVAFRQDGSVAWTTARSWYLPGRMTWSAQGTLYVTDAFHNVIRELSYGQPGVPQGTAVTVRLDTVERAVSAGTTTGFQVSLRNRSARTDTFTVKSTVSGGSGWSNSVSPASVRVSSGATGTVEVTVRVPVGLAPGTAGAVDIAVHSALDPASVTTVHARVVIRNAPPVVVGGVLVETSMGATVQVPLDAQDAENLYGAGCRVTYDDKVLQFVSIAKGDLMGPDTLFIEEHGIAGEVRIASTLKGDAQPVSGNGSIAVLTFRALEGGTTQLDVDELQLFGGDGGRQELASKARSIPVRVLAEQPRTVLVLRVGLPTMKVGSSSIVLDAPPVIVEGRTLIPIRAIIESLGGTVAWDADSRTVTISLDGTKLNLVIGKSSALVNGKSTPIDSTNPKVVPQILNSRTMLPLRFVAESLGADVQWEASTQTITITYPKP
ncbi:MAG TPA: stalk domain-containing protein [Candidatus Deferrimicrobium sp.]|nr:stalk domain-containing protein [Candidatus Deferrimicrobium sp.]